MSAAPAAVFVMPEQGHFQRMRAVIAGLATRGPVHVFADRRFQEAIEAAGGTFVDMFGKYPLADADDSSVPVPCRYVTYAGVYAEPVIEELRRIGPSVVVYDMFAVIAHVAARALGIPYVNVCAGHAVDPARFLAMVKAVKQKRVSQACHAAVEALRERHGLLDASPFSYITSGLSPHLNIYCEPPEFITEDERRPLEPLGFYGSLAPTAQLEARELDTSPSEFGTEPAELQVYVAFGTVVWRYWTEQAASTLTAISEALAARDDARAVVSLGGCAVDAELIEAFARPNVTVARWVDQWRILRDADVFVTHHGLNSTHEAIYRDVPMISYPFANDQPGMARRCRELGLAVPLAEEPRGAVTPKDVETALAEVSAERDSLRAGLARARGWELEVMARRGAVLDQISSLAET